MSVSSSFRLLPRLARSSGRISQTFRSCMRHPSAYTTAELSTISSNGNVLWKSVFPVASRLSSVRYASSKPQPDERDVEHRVMKVCRAFEKINPDKISLETHFMNDLGLDSLDHVELIMALEDEFGFEISDQDAEKLVRPADLIKYIVMRKTPLPDQ